MDKLDNTIKNAFKYIGYSLFLISITPIISILLFVVATLVGPYTNWNIKPIHDPGFSYLMILIAGFGICIAISGIAPFIIAKYITQKDIEKAVDNKFNENFFKTLNLLQRSEADHSRMNAYFLFALGKPIWAIGWMARSLIRYQDYKHRKDENEDIRSRQGDYNNIVKLCIPTIIGCMKLFETKIKEKHTDNSDLNQIIQEIYNQDNHEENNRVATRAVSDLIDFLLGRSSQNNSIGINCILKDEEELAINAFLKLLIKSLALNEKELDELQKNSWHSEKGDSFKNKYRHYQKNVEKKEIIVLYEDFQNKLKEIFKNPIFEYTDYFETISNYPIINKKEESFLRKLFNRF